MDRIENKKKKTASHVLSKNQISYPDHPNILLIFLIFV